jgi:hypothetical protein
MIVPVASAISAVFGGRPPRATAPRAWAAARPGALAKSCAALLLLAGIMIPTCCLDGSHHGAGALDGSDPICFARSL